LKITEPLEKRHVQYVLVPMEFTGSVTHI